MKKLKLNKIIWIIALILIPFVDAYIGLPQTSFNVSQANMNKSALFFYDDFIDSNGSGEYNGSKWTTEYVSGGTNFIGSVSGASTEPGESMLNFTGDNDIDPGTAGIKTSVSSGKGQCIDFRVKMKEAPVVGTEISIGQGTGTASENNANRRIWVDIPDIFLQDGSTHPWPDSGQDIGDETGDWINITVIINIDGTSQLYFNNSYDGSLNASFSTYAQGQHTIQMRDVARGLVDYYYVYNCSKGFPTLPAAPPVDTTPAGLKSPDSAGCTSCVPYQNLLTQPWDPGGDTTPTMNATADESLSGMACIANNTNAGNYNMSDIIRYGGIAGTGSGAGPWSCTIQASNAFNTENGYLCVAFNDTSGNQNRNASFCAQVIYDLKPRINASLNNSVPRINDIVNMTANVSDKVGLSFCQFIHNQSGPTGLIYLNKSVTGTDDQCSQNWTIDLIRGNVINFTVLVNNTNNNFNWSEQIVTIANTPPSGLSIIFPTSNLYTNNQPLDFNVTFSADADSDSITINYYINGKINDSTNVNTTFNASDGYYWLNASLWDGYDSSADNATVNFTLDTTYPIIDFSGDTADNDSTFIRDWIHINTTVTETNFKNITFYLYDSTGLISNFTNTTGALNYTFISIDFSEPKRFYYNVTICDKVNYCNSTETRQINLQPLLIDINVTETIGVDFDFYPTQPIQTEVEAWGQTNTLGALSVDNNYTSTLDIFVKLNETNSRITLKLDNSSVYADSITLNTSYQLIMANLSVDALRYIWAWADYNAPTSVWDPELQFKGVKI